MFAQTRTLIIVEILAMRTRLKCSGSQEDEIGSAVSCMKAKDGECLSQCGFLSTSVTVCWHGWASPCGDVI